jgi:hypothetical protein
VDSRSHLVSVPTRVRSLLCGVGAYSGADNADAVGASPGADGVCTQGEMRYRIVQSNIEVDMC